MRIFINERPCETRDGASALAAVGDHDRQLAEQINRGGAYLTDGRGIRLRGDEALAAGAILRVVTTARRGGDADVDA